MADAPFRILLLEDNSADAELILRQLRREGVVPPNVTRVATEADFRREIESGTYDVVLADYVLPSFDGLTAMRIARQFQPAIPVIFVSGSIGEDRAVEALRLGATDYILKDRLGRLGDAVRRAHGEAQQIQRRLDMQHALLLSEQRFHYAVQATRDVIWELDADRDTIWISGTIAAEMGYPISGEMPASWYRDRIHPEDRARVEGGILAALTAGERWGDEFRFRRASGSYAEVFARGVVAPDASGRGRRLIGAMQDISERKSAEARAISAERLARLGRWSWDIRSGHVKSSAELFRIFDVPPADDVTVESFLGRIHREDIERVLDDIDPAHPRPDFEYRVVWRDGTERVVHTTAQWELDDRGVAIRGDGVAQDVTDRVVSERRIRDLSRVNAMVLEYAAEGIVACDADERLVFANPAASRLLGWSGDPTGVSIHQFLGGCHGEEQRCDVTLPLRAGHPSSGELEFRRVDGSQFEVGFSATPVVDGGIVTGCVVAFRDITERRRLEKQLEQAQRISSLGKIAATIAHEFNNVLMGIQPFAELVRKRAGDDDKLKLAATQMLASVARGKRITSDILRTTQIAEPALQPCDIGSFLTSLEPQLRSIFPESVLVELHVARQPVVALCDSSQLQQVVMNLAVNARDAMPNGGRFTITADALRSPGGARRIRIVVSDTGLGIAADILPYIFEPLFTTKRTGTGLGLAVSQQLVARNHGSILVESTAGEGTRFELLLPAAAAAYQIEKHAMPEAPAVDRLLLIEDDEIVAAGIAALLEMHGVRVRILYEPADVISVIEEFEPRAVVLDLRLGDTDGMTVYSAIAGRWPEMPVVLASGDETGGRLIVENAHAHVRFLRKPFEVEALFAALREIA